MKTLIDNWYVIVGLVCLGGVLGYNAQWFIKLPRDAKIKIIRSVLVMLVKLAEDKFGGGGTGKQKLEWVYNKIMEIPLLDGVDELLSYDKFNDYVKEALVKSGIWLAGK